MLISQCRFDEPPKVHGPRGNCTPSPPLGGPDWWGCRCTVDHNQTIAGIQSNYSGDISPHPSRISAPLPVLL